MKKETTLETNDEAVDLGRRSMMGRFGLIASLACAAPVLMTVSTSALANHKTKAQDTNGECGNNSARSGNTTAMKNACPDTDTGTTPPGPTPGDPIITPELGL